jgi:hypothetical protein
MQPSDMTSSVNWVVFAHWTTMTSRLTCPTYYKTSAIHSWHSSPGTARWRELTSKAPLRPTSNVRRPALHS